MLKPDLIPKLIFTYPHRKKTTVSWCHNWIFFLSGYVKMILKNMLYVRMSVWTRWLNSSSPGLKLLKTAIWEDSSAVPLAPSHADCDLALDHQHHPVLVVHSLHESVERDTGNHTQTKHYRHVLEMDLFTEYMYIYREKSWLNKE